MSLPAPNLDDRSFQHLVDDAKRFIQQRCPDWTDHNVSDPGVTLVETFAWMTELLLYRLNRVPDRNYVKFLELIGVQLFPATPSRTSVTFRLATAQEGEVRVPVGTVVSTPRAPGVESIAFTTIEDAICIPARSESVLAITASGEVDDYTPRLGIGEPFACFSDPPLVDDCLYVGLDQPAPSNLIRVHVVCEVGGTGIYPDSAPIVWEAWNGHEWKRCHIENDSTLGLNVDGDIELLLPEAHERSTVGRVNAAWVRARIVGSDEDNAYQTSPLLISVAADGVGAAARVWHGEEILGELVGHAEGVPGQSLLLKNAPIVADDRPIVLEVRPHPSGGGDGPSGPTEQWTLVSNFAESTEDDPHFTLDRTTGEVRFGCLVRNADGTYTQYGRVPPKGATLHVDRYRTGGGQCGNVSARTLTELRSSIPFVARVSNALPATGGVDAETVDEARVRGPIVMRTRNRAVTLEDYEVLAREIAPELARVRSVWDETRGLLRVLVIPSVGTDDDGAARLEDLLPSRELIDRIREHLDERRVIGARFVVEPPSYVGITVAVAVRARSHCDDERVVRDARKALYRHFSPFIGGIDGGGWPFGRPVDVGEVYAVLQSVPGVDLVENLELFVSDPHARTKSNSPQARVELAPGQMVLSFEHEVVDVRER